MRLNRQIVIIPEETGGYSVSCPSLPGCHSQGESIDEAIANIREAIELYSNFISKICLLRGKVFPKTSLIASYLLYEQSTSDLWSAIYLGVGKSRVLCCQAKG
jgi:predicted RNase H-like HicB family nuclease